MSAPEIRPAPKIRPDFVFVMVAAVIAAIIADFFVIPFCVLVLTLPDQNHLDHYAVQDRILEASGAKPEVVFMFRPLEINYNSLIHIDYCQHLTRWAGR
ncbi:MAG TPA: hypothetical protein VGF71_00600 [Caulobacteraceae bacterium]